MSMIERVYEKAKKDPKRIVFPEGDEKRTLLAAEKLNKAGICRPILVGNAEKIRAAVLEKMEVHRKTFRALLNEEMAPAHFPDSRRLPHKFLIRVTKRPLQILRYGLWHPRPN